MSEEEEGGLGWPEGLGSEAQAEVAGKKKKMKNWISPMKKSVVMQGEEGEFHTKRGQSYHTVLSGVTSVHGICPGGTGK